MAVKKTTKKVVKAPVVEVEIKQETVEVEPEVVTEPVEQTESALNENEEVVQLHPVEKKTKKLTKEKLQSDWENLFTIYEQELVSLKKKPEQKAKLSKYLNSLKGKFFLFLFLILLWEAGIFSLMQLTIYLTFANRKN